MHYKAVLHILITTITTVTPQLSEMVLPGSGVGTTKALSSTSLRGSVTSTLFPADTTSSLTAEEDQHRIRDDAKIKKKYYNCTVGMATKKMRQRTPRGE